jgi:hypothetical protein
MHMNTRNWSNSRIRRPQVGRRGWPIRRIAAGTNEQYGYLNARLGRGSYKTADCSPQATIDDRRKLRREVEDAH